MCVWRVGVMMMKMKMMISSASLVTAAGAAGGLSRLCQVHSSVATAAGPGSLRLVLGKFLCCNYNETKFYIIQTEVLKIS